MDTRDSDGDLSKKQIKTQPQLCGKGMGEEGNTSFWAYEGPAQWAVSLYRVPGAKDLPGTRRRHQNTYYSNSISFLIGSHSPQTPPLSSLSIIPVHLSLTLFITCSILNCFSFFFSFLFW